MARMDWDKARRQDRMATRVEYPIESVYVSIEVVAAWTWPTGLIMGVLRVGEDLLYARWDPCRKDWVFRLLDWQRERLEKVWLASEERKAIKGEDQ